MSPKVSVDAILKRALSNHYESDEESDVDKYVPRGTPVCGGAAHVVEGVCCVVRQQDRGGTWLSCYISLPS